MNPRQMATQPLIFGINNLCSKFVGDEVLGRLRHVLARLRHMLARLRYVLARLRHVLAPLIDSM